MLHTLPRRSAASELLGLMAVCVRLEPRLYAVAWDRLNDELATRHVSSNWLERYPELCRPAEETFEEAAHDDFLFVHPTIRFKKHQVELNSHIYHKVARRFPSAT